MTSHCQEVYKKQGKSIVDITANKPVKFKTEVELHLSQSYS